VWDDRRRAERESGELGEVAERDREQSKHETEKAARQPATSTSTSTATATATSTSATRRDFAVRTAAARLAVPATINVVSRRDRQHRYPDMVSNIIMIITDYKIVMVRGGVLSLPTWFPHDFIDDVLSSVCV